MSLIEPEILATRPLGSGRRLNLIREYIKLGLTPCLIRDETIRSWLPFSYEQLAHMTDTENLREQNVQVYYHPMQLAKVLGKSDSHWGDQARTCLDAGMPEAYSIKVTPTSEIHAHLQSLGIVQGTRRSPVRVIDFNLVAYMIATLKDNTGDVPRITLLNQYKNVTQNVGGLSVHFLSIPSIDETSFQEVLEAAQHNKVSADNVVNGMINHRFTIPTHANTGHVSDANPPSITIIPPVDRAFMSDVEGLDVRNIQDPEALIRRLQEEVSRRKSKEVLDRWLDARVVDVNLVDGEVHSLTLRLNDGVEMDFVTRQPLIETQAYA